MATYAGILARLRSELPDGVKLTFEPQADKSLSPHFVVWDAKYGGATYWKGRLQDIDVRVGTTRLFLTDEEKKALL